MNDLIQINSSGQAVAISRDIAEHFQKEHKNVLRDIDALKKDVLNFEQMFFETEIPDSYGRPQRAYLMNRDGFSLLAMGFTGKAGLEWKVKYICAFNAMEKTIKNHLPQDYPSALRAPADAEEKRLRLEAENATQRQAIADFEPIRQYVDTILESPGTMTATQIAADYDISAKRLNAILCDAGIQRYVNGQWILYRRHMGKGYTKSKTFNFVHSDGRPDVKPQTQWTQKGRLMIHELLTARGIVAVMDKRIGA